MLLSRATPKTAKRFAFPRRLPTADQPLQRAVLPGTGKRVSTATNGAIALSRTLDVKRKNAAIRAPTRPSKFSRLVSQAPETFLHSNPEIQRRAADPRPLHSHHAVRHEPGLTPRCPARGTDVPASLGSSLNMHFHYLSSAQARLVYRLPKPTPDRRTELRLTPLELLERLVQLIPPRADTDIATMVSLPQTQNSGSGS